MSTTGPNPAGTAGAHSARRPAVLTTTRRLRHHPRGGLTDGQRLCEGEAHAATVPATVIGRTIHSYSERINRGELAVVPKHERI